MITIHNQGNKQFYNAGGGDVITDIDSNFTEVQNNINAIVVPTKATGADVTTGTDDAKFVTAKALQDAGVPKNLVKANGGEVNAGTDDAKFVTAKAIADSNVAFTSDIPVKATGAEINTGTDDVKYVTAKAIADSNIAFESYVDTRSWTFIAGNDIILASDDIQEKTSSATYVKLKEFTLSTKHTASSITVTFTLSYVANGDGGATVYGDIYKNGVSTGSEISTTSGGGAQIRTTTINCVAGDLIQIYAKVVSGISAEASITNFRLLGKLSGYATLTA